MGRWLPTITKNGNASVVALGLQRSKQVSMLGTHQHLKTKRVPNKYGWGGVTGTKV